jgi:hypothetical protein
LAETTTLRPVTVTEVTLELLRTMAAMCTREADLLARLGSATYYAMVLAQEEESARG